MHMHLLTTANSVSAVWFHKMNNAMTLILCGTSASQVSQGKHEQKENT